MWKKSPPDPEGQVTCDAPSCHVTKPERQMPAKMDGVRLCSDACEQAWVRAYVKNPAAMGP